METVAQILSDVEFWKITVPVLTVVIAWLLNERARRQGERERRLLNQQKRKRASYRRLLKSSRGFTEGQQDATDLKKTFLDELQLCWLHASDDVIRKAYAFLGTVHTDAVASATDRETAMAEFVATLRNDALSHSLVAKSGLKARDYRLLRVN